MNRDIVIEVKNVSKNYRLYDKPSGRLKEIILNSKKVKATEHYALRNLSFSVKKGETFGIIGDNGAGKSTLLKLITGVTRASSGEIAVEGKVSALLELGAGFNKEYTGIENIYLNGSMMGFSKEEMSKKVDEILSFADIGDYVHQKVKTYSSGMFARLAFSVAINVEPEVLIVDEALSVGDVFFQNKCFKKFEELKAHGVTILFVSHDIHSVKQMCDRALWLEGGMQRMLGDSVSVCNAYTNSVYERNCGENRALVGGNTGVLGKYDMVELQEEDYPPVHYTEESILHDKVKIISCYLTDKNNKITAECEVNQEYKINVVFETQINIEKCIAGFVLETKKGLWMINSNSAMCGKKVPFNVKDKTINKVTFTFKMPAFMKGEYVIGCAISQGTMEKYEVMTWLYNVLAITIINNGNNSGIIDVDTDIIWQSKRG